jgi:glucose-6-phosphate isomerase
MDEHFKTADFDKTCLFVAMLAVCYNNFFDAESEALIPCTQYQNLHLFAAGHHE